MSSKPVEELGDLSLLLMKMELALLRIRDKAQAGAYVDGAHHKQFYLAEICAMFDVNIEDKGIAP